MLDLNKDDGNTTNNAVVVVTTNITGGTRSIYKMGHVNKNQLRSH